MRCKSWRWQICCDQKERLAAYGTQARFAVAQIYDRASTAREDGRALPQ